MGPCYCSLMGTALGEPPISNLLESSEYVSPTVRDNNLTVYDHMFCQMYQEFMTALDEAGKNDACVVAMVTGTGDYYCSGNDLSNFTRIPPEGPQKMASDARQILK